MKKVSLGNTGLEIAPLVFGSLPLGPLQADLPPEEGGRLIREALEEGVTLIDTAEMYATYGHIREGLRGYDGAVQIATKTHAADWAAARRHVERALRELRRERLDIVHLHGARIRDPFAERAAVFEELQELKAEGKIAHIGLSSHYIAAIRAAIDHPEVEVLHPLINRTGMGILDGSAAQMAAAIADAATAGKGIYAMKALAGGNLIASARRSLEWVRALPGVHGLAVGMLSREEILANRRLLAGEDPGEELWQTLQARRRTLRIMEQFCKGCGQCIPACTNHALALVDGRARVAGKDCILCGYCAAACPEFLIRVV